MFASISRTGHTIWMKKPDAREVSPPAPSPAHVGVTEAGPGVTLGDWQIGGTYVAGTDNRYDLPQLREAAERHEEDVREAARLGEKPPDPLGDMVKHARGRVEAPESDPLMASIHDAIDKQKK